jgi:hypothetical protein
MQRVGGKDVVIHGFEATNLTTHISALLQSKFAQPLNCDYFCLVKKALKKENPLEHNSRNPNFPLLFSRRI